MAGAGFKDFQAGEVLTAVDVDTYLMQQTVMVFAGTAARGSAIGTPTEGMFSYLKDTDALEYYTGASWVAFTTGGGGFETNFLLMGAQVATNYKIIGQLDMTSASLTTLYTCPSATETVISTIIIANRAAAADTFRLALRDGGEAISDKHYLAYDVPVAANDSTTLTLGVTMSATDVLSVAAGGTASELSINAFGAEVTV